MKLFRKNKKQLNPSIEIIKSIITNLQKNQNNLNEQTFKDIINSLCLINENFTRDDITNMNHLPFNLLYNLLYSSINEFSNKTNKNLNYITIEIYYHLIRIFPFGATLLNTKFNNRNVLFHSLNSNNNLSQDKKLEMYNSITENFQKLSIYEEKLLFELYTFLYTNLFISKTNFKIEEFSKYKQFFELFIQDYNNLINNKT